MKAKYKNTEEIQSLSFSNDITNDKFAVVTKSISSPKSY